MDTPPDELLAPVEPPAELLSLLVTLFQRRREGVFPRQATAQIGEWRPQPHCCYKNCDEWVRFNPNDKRVDGFTYFNFQLFGFVKFTPHAVIEVEDGTLVDITPHGSLDPHPFIRHIGSPEEFLAMQEAAHVGRNGVDFMLR